MSKSVLTLAMMVLPLAAVAGSGASDPFQIQQTPAYEKRADAALLFESADRQSAFADQLQSDGAQRYLAFAGAPRLHFGALEQNMTLLDPLGPMLNDRSKRFLSSAEFEKKMGRAIGILTIGMLRETGSALGTQQSSALALNIRPTTTFTSASIGYALSARSSLMAMASYGKTEGIGNPDSLLGQVSSVRTMAYSVGAVRRDLFSNHDRMAMTLSVPAKVRNGSLEYSGNIQKSGDPNAQAFGTPTLNLRPSATERDLELGYTTLVGKEGRSGKVTGAIMWRVNPGHDANAPPDWLTGVRYSYGF